MVTAVVVAAVGGRLAGLMVLVLVPLLIVGLVAYGIWELVRSAGSAVPAGAGGVLTPSVTARAVLDERFARGEIDPDDYVRRRSLLDGVPLAPVARAPGDEASPVPAAAPTADEPVTAEAPAAAPLDPPEAAPPAG